MPTFFNFNNRKGVFMIPAGATKSPTPAPPSFSNTKSLAFDGVDEYVSLGDIQGFDGASQLTISAWVKVNNTTDTQFIISKYSNNNNRTHIAIASNLIYFNTSNGSSSFGSVAFTSTDWAHIAMVFNGSESGNSNRLKAYINGVEQTLTFSGTIPSTLTDAGTNNVEISRQNVGNYLEGNIDELSLYNTALSDADISTIATAPSDLSSYNPIAWYRMGDNSTYQTPQILMPENTNKDKVSNYSLSMDGVDDYIGIGTTSLGITSAITVSAWVKIPTTNVGGPSPNIQIIAAEDTTGGSNRNWNLFWRHQSVSDKYFRFQVWHTDGSVSFIESTGIVPNDNNWHHIMGTFDGTTDANGLKLYVDSTLFQTTAGSTGIRSTLGVAPSIGANESGSAWRFEGNIDEVAVWNSVQDVSSIYNSGEPTTITGATAYWKLGEQATFSTNWTVPDQVGSNDGTSANMTIEDRVGDASNSSNNAVSFNMEAGDIDNDTP